MEETERNKLVETIRTIQELQRRLPDFIIDIQRDRVQLRLDAFGKFFIGHEIISTIDANGNIHLSREIDGIKICACS